MIKGSGQCLERGVDREHTEDAEVSMAVSEQLLSKKDRMGHIG